MLSWSVGGVHPRVRTNRGQADQHSRRYEGVPTGAAEHLGVTQEWAPWGGVVGVMGVMGWWFDRGVLGCLILVSPAREARTP